MSKTPRSWLCATDGPAASKTSNATRPLRRPDRRVDGGMFTPESGRDLSPKPRAVKSTAASRGIFSGDGSGYQTATTAGKVLHGYRADPDREPRHRDAEAPRGRAGLFRRDLEHRGAVRARVRLDIRAGQPVAFRGEGHPARPALPGSAPCPGQARALRAGCCLGRGG